MLTFSINSLYIHMGEGLKEIEKQEKDETVRLKMFGVFKSNRDSQQQRQEKRKLKVGINPH